MVTAVAVNGYLALGERGSTEDPAPSAYSAPDSTVGGVLSTQPAALFPTLEPTATTYVEVRQTATPEATPTPALAPSVAAATSRVAASGGQLTEAEMRAVLTEAGWPVELHEQALAVAWCESKWSPYAAGDSGNSLGLFQLNALWFRYSGTALEGWSDPVTNARVAYATYLYDLGRGQAPFTQWSCKP